MNTFVTEAKIGASRMISVEARRDEVLDFAKALGIILVVLGHTFQSRLANFDEFIGFTMIYSFHMPFFAFLSGAAAMRWMLKMVQFEDAFDVAKSAGLRIRRSFMMLIVPFVTWTVITYVIAWPPGGLPAYLWLVAQHPDITLWFLPAIFWCITYAAFFLVLSAAIRELAAGTSAERYLAPFSPFGVQMVLLLALWTAVKEWLPTMMGLGFANSFFNGLFFFFIVGTLLYRPFLSTQKLALRAAPYILFALLIPFWHRTAPGNLLPDAPWILHRRPIASNYTTIVAFAGIFSASDFSRLVASLGQKQLRLILNYLGTRSLAIYALHFHFLALWLWPPFFAPLVLSLAFYEVLTRIPVVRVALFGRQASNL